MMVTKLLKRLYNWSNVILFKEPYEEWRPGRESYVVIGYLLAFTLVIVVGAVFIGAESWVLIGTPSGNLDAFSRLLLLMVLCGLAWIAMALKSKAQFAYGCLELVFGLLATYTVLGRQMSDDRIQNLVPLIGSVYLLNRGLNNIREAKEKKAVASIET